MTEPRIMMIKDGVKTDVTNTFFQYNRWKDLSLVKASIDFKEESKAESLFISCDGNEWKLI